MTLVWPTRRQALEWVFIGLFVLAACLLLVPRGNAASVKVPPGQLWTCHVAEAEADMMSGPEMYSQRGDSSLSTGWIVTMTARWICSRSTTCEDRRFTSFHGTTYTTKTSMESRTPPLSMRWATGSAARCGRLIRRTL